MSQDLLMNRNQVHLNQMLSANAMRDLDGWIAKYPADQKQSAVMAALRIAQDEHTYLTPALMDAIAQYLAMPKIHVYEVATFYSMYELRPVGKHVINVCTNISCQLAGTERIVKYLQNTLQIAVGETTVDGRFTLRAVECLGACVNAPIMQVDKDYHENLTLQNLTQILDQYTD